MRKASQFRHACEECHERKIRCRQKDTESERCEACRANGRRCLFSLKSKTGRPGRRKASSTFVTNSFSTKSVPEKFSPSGHSSTTASPYTTVDSVPWLFGTEFDKLFLCSPPQGESFWDPQEKNGAGDKDYHLVPYGLGMSTTLDSVLDNVSRGDQARHVTSGEFILSNFEQTAPKKTVEERTEGSFETGDTISEVVSPDTGERGVDSTLEPLSQSDSLTNGRATAKVADYLKVLGLSHELRPPLESIFANKASLLANRDAPKVNTLLDSLDKICNTIGIMIDVSCADVTVLDGSPNVFFYATIMDTISQVIRKLGSWAELDPDSRTGLTQNTLSTALDFTMEPSYFGFEYTLFSSVEMDGSEPPVPDLQLERVLSLTRLDFYLLRLKSYISHFDSESELLVATATLFSPAELKRSLLALHNRVDSILCAWKRQWGK